MIALLLLSLTIGLTLGMLARFGFDSALTKMRQIKHQRLSKRETLTLVTVAFIGFGAWLYLTTFAGIMDFACRTGEITIKADSLLPARAFSSPASVMA
jgi:O-antigen/teichoic acid export membrane protein